MASSGEDPNNIHTVKLVPSDCIYRTSGWHVIGLGRMSEEQIHGRVFIHIHILQRHAYLHLEGPGVKGGSATRRRKCPTTYFHPHSHHLVCGRGRPGAQYRSQRMTSPPEPHGVRCRFLSPSSGSFPLPYLRLPP